MDRCDFQRMRAVSPQQPTHRSTSMILKDQGTWSDQLVRLVQVLLGEPPAKTSGKTGRTTRRTCIYVKQGSVRELGQAE